MSTVDWLVMSVILTPVLSAVGMWAGFRAGRMHERVVWLEAWPDLPEVH